MRAAGSIAATLVITALGACAAPEPRWAPRPVAEATFDIAPLLPRRPVQEVQAAPSVEARGEIERFRFASGFAAVQLVHPGSKITEPSAQALADRAAVEAWARSLRMNRTLTEVVAADPVVHERVRGAGWLLGFATSDPGVRCTAGRAVYAMVGVGDDAGFAYDTALSALFCQPVGADGSDVAALFRRLPPPRGS